MTFVSSDLRYQDWTFSAFENFKNVLILKRKSTNILKDFRSSYQTLDEGGKHPGQIAGPSKYWKNSLMLLFFPQNK